MKQNQHGGRENSKTINGVKKGLFLSQNSEDFGVVNMMIACSNQVWFIAKITNWLHRSRCPKHDTISTEEGRNNHKKISLLLCFAYCEKYEYFTSWDKDSWLTKAALYLVSLPKLHECNVAIAFPHLLLLIYTTEMLGTPLLFSSFLTSLQTETSTFDLSSDRSISWITLAPVQLIDPWLFFNFPGTRKRILSHRLKNGWFKIEDSILFCFSWRWQPRIKTQPASFPFNLSWVSLGCSHSEVTE